MLLPLCVISFLGRNPLRGRITRVLSRTLETAWHAYGPLRGDRGGSGAPALSRFRRLVYVINRQFILGHKADPTDQVVVVRAAC